MRIVSLLPAATEICYALGLGGAIVGVSPECDHPAAARTKPIVSRALLPYEGKSSGETSRMVGERLASGGGLYQVDVEALARNLSRPPKILSLDPHTLTDVLADIARAGRLCDMEERAREVVDGLRGRIDTVEIG